MPKCPNEVEVAMLLLSNNNIGSLLLKGDADKAAIIDGLAGRKWPYAELAALASRLGSVLASAGAVPGDRVAVRLEKSVMSLALYLAVLRAGMVYVPLNTALAAPEVEFHLRDAAPSVFITHAEALAEIEIAQALHIPHVLTSGGQQSAALERLAAMAPGSELREVESDATAVLVYTSGTTGRSKGAMVTHGNLIANAKGLAEAWRFCADDVVLHALPLFHGHGLFLGVHLPLIAGGTILMLPRFDSERVIDMLPSASVFMGVPTFYSRLLASPRLDAVAVAGTRLFTSGSAPLLPETLKEFYMRTGRPIVERYGTTETSIIASNPIDDGQVAGAVGFPIPSVEMRITDVRRNRQCRGQGPERVQGLLASGGRKRI
jgi:malonyl-CoA/methylmalonyl-CoA synthetase